MRASYSKKVSDYLNSHEFLEENQMIYLKRFKSISETALGEKVELLNCYKRLAKMGLVKYDPNFVIKWNNVRTGTGR